VLGDDGEKFGGWPGTRQWVYGTGWLDDFLDAIERLRTDETVKLITTGEAAARDSGGLVYPAPGSYREMEGWALPRPAALELERLRDRSAFGADHPSIRGGHWRNFQSRYAVSNRMHKTALALSLLCRERGEPSAARAAIARGQCNDAYWHGVFGGVYLPHLRRGVWRELATAEGILRAGENMGVTAVDHDFDGHDEVWVHGPRCSAIVSPRRGGAIESLLRFDAGENDLDILERHFEAYHGDPDTAPTWAEVAARWSVVDDPTEASDEAGSASIASIHDREPPERPAPPAIDPQPPAMFREWIRRGGDGETTTTPVAHRLDDISVRPDEVTLTLSALLDGTTIRKRILVTDTGMIRMDLEWECPDLSDEATVWTEIWLAFARVLEPSLPVSEEREEVVTLARSEQGYEEIRQGEIVRYGWPAAAGRATVWISAPN
jgi:hypothetical protein